MVDTNLLNNISNLLANASSQVQATPVPVAYTSAVTSLLGVGSAILVAIGAIGRAWQAVKNDASILKALVLGTNSTTAMVKQVQTNSVVLKTIPVAEPTPVPLPTVAPPSLK